MNHPRPPSRRRFIELLGGGLVLAAAPLASGCSAELPAAAIAPWQAGTDEPDLRRFMLAHALLAPNPHNRQPWRADLRREGEITLICDGDRLLPHTDPYGRQIVMGCGAFVELAVMAAAERGVAVQVLPFPDGEPGLTEATGGRSVARLVLQTGAAPARDPLFAQIRRRHTNREAYDNTRPLDASQWQQLNAAASGPGLMARHSADGATMAKLREITRAAFVAEISTADTWRESAELMRIGPDEIERHRDGISLNRPLVRAVSALGLFDRFELPKPGSSGFDRVMQTWAASETGSGYLWIASVGHSRAVQLAAGRAYVRQQLQATAMGLAMQPLSQALQEFAAVRPMFDAVHQLLGVDPAQGPIQMLARVGQPLQAVGPSPRRGLQALLA